jgi:hypothetical protein
MSDELKVNPLNYVANLESPISVYLRRVIFKKETKADEILKRRLYEHIVPDQSLDGSWNQLFVRTANNLWNLALLGCDAEDKSVKKGVRMASFNSETRLSGLPGFFPFN